MTVVHILEFVEDEQLFSSIGFLKSNLHNNLKEHLQVVVGMYCEQIFTLENFLYYKVFDKWFVCQGRGRYLASA